MNPEQWQKVSSLLDQVLELPAGERSSFLQKLRGEDAGLCQEVESLLQQQSQVGLLQSPPSRLLEELQPTVIGSSTDPGHDGSVRLPSHAGRYVVQEEIARGGMGAILRVVDPAFQRTLAVKILLPEARVDPDAERRFLQEAQITGRLQHPGIPPIHELGRLDDGRPFFAMKLVEGQTLTALLTKSADREGRFLGIFEQICRTLAYAHSQHFIHRDLKPSNVMVGAFGEVQVMDWGLAKEIGKAEGGNQKAESGRQKAEETQQGNILGTPAFMAPEQARGEIDSLDERCDVFGLGGIVCAILTGRAPFSGSETMEVVGKAAAGDVREVFAALDECGGERELIALAKQCLAPVKEERYRHAGEVADAVTRYRETAQEKLKQAELAREKAQVQAAEERRRRRLTLTLAASILILVVGAAGAGLWYQQHRAQQQAQARALNDLVSQALDDSERESNDLIKRLADATLVRPLLNDLRVWRDAVSRAQAAWQRAKHLGDSQAEKLAPRTLERMQSLNSSLQADDANWRFASKLDALATEQAISAGGKYDWFRAGPKFLGAFAEKGWDIKDGDPVELAERIAKSPLRFAVVDALDTLAVLGSDKIAGRVLEIARHADPDPWRNKIRTRQPEEHVLAYHMQLATNMDYATQPPLHLRLLAVHVAEGGGNGIAIARKALLYHPGDFWLNFWLSTQGADAKEKVSYCRAALALRPTSGVAHSWLGYLLATAGDGAGAVEHCKKGIQLNPDEPQAHYALGYVLSSSDDVPGAIAAYQEAVRLDPESAAAYRSLGLALRKKGDEAAAQKALQRSRELLSKSQANVPQLTLQTNLEMLREGIAGRLTKDLPIDPIDAESQGYYQVYAVLLEAGKHYQFDLSGNFDTLLRVEDPERRPLVFNDDMAQPSNLNSRLVFSPGANSVYHLIATSCFPDTIGDYRLKATEVAQVENPVVLTGNLAETTELFKGKFLVRHPRTLNADHRYVIELQSSAFDTYLVLGGLAENDGIVPGTRRHARIDFTPPKTGEYIIGVTSRQPGQTGAYTLSVKSYSPVR